MIAYNDTVLQHTYIRRQAKIALEKSIIEKPECVAVGKAYPQQFYTPNQFIRVGLFGLTAVIALMCLGLLLLIFGPVLHSATAAGALGMFFSILLYTALEYLVRRMKHFRSGVDDALLWISTLGLFITMNTLDSNISRLVDAILVFALAAYSMLRFANAVMSGIAYLSLLMAIFYGTIRLGPAARVMMPFLLMIVSISIYLLTHRIKNSIKLRHFRRCCVAMEGLALLTIYASVNYFVVRELSNQLFDLHLKEGESVPAGWLFWIITLIAPPIYLFTAFRKKDRLLLHAGLVLVAAAVFTVRYYYHFLPVEMAMTVGGIMLILLAYLTTRYISSPKYGITSKPAGDSRASYFNAEALIIAETFPATPDAGAGKHIEFEGGSGGGAGASGEY